MLVNIEEENAYEQKRKTLKRKIDVSGLIHKRSKQSDMMLACEMFHNIYYMYSDIKNNEETNADLLLTIMSYHKGINKAREKH